MTVSPSPSTYSALAGALRLCSLISSGRELSGTKTHSETELWFMCLCVFMTDAHLSFPSQKQNPPNKRSAHIRP